MKKIFIIFLFISIIFFQSVLSYSVDTSSLNNDVNVGNNLLGNIVLNTDFETHIINSITEIDGQVFRQHDKIRWMSESTTFIVNGVNKPFVDYDFFSQDMNLDTAGVYYYNSEPLFQVQPRQNPEIILKNVPTAMNVSFSNNFVLPNNLQSMMSLEIDKNMVSGNYNLEFGVMEGGNEITTFTIPIKVLDDKSIRIDDDDLRDEFVGLTGIVVDVGYIRFYNEGNTDILIKSNITGDGRHLVILPQEQNLFRGSSVIFPITIQTPTSHNIGNYSFEIDFFIDNERAYTIEDVVVVNDGIKPKINSVEFEHELVRIMNTLYVEATDNVDIGRVYLKYDNNTYDFTHDEDDLFFLNHSFTRLSRYIISICAEDISENKMCFDFNKTFSRVDFLDVNSFDVNFPSVRYSRYSRLPLFNLSSDLSDPIKLSINRLRIHTDDVVNDDISIRVIDGDGSIRRFRDTDDEIILEKEGIIYVEIMSEKVSEITGSFELILPNYMEERDLIDFSVEYKDYDVPQSFAHEWFGKEIVCDVVDTGNLDTSFYDCSVKLDISTSVDNLPMPTTLKDKERLENDMNSTITEYKKERNAYRFIMSVVLAMFVISILVFMFIVKFYPYMRIMSNYNEKKGGR